VPRYLIERTFPGGLAISADKAGHDAFDRVVNRNADVGVTWLHSYLSENRQAMVCVYEGPGAEAIRTAAELNHLPVDRITQVCVLDPHPYR
jgi:hypothetical protein